MLVTTTIRPATTPDIPAVVGLGMRFATETAYGQIVDADADRLTALVTGLVASGDAVLLVAEDAEGLHGLIGLVIAQHPMSRLRVASELVWWVNPESRGHGRALLSAAEGWAEDHGAQLLFMIAPDAAVGRLYERAGYQVLETTYYRRL